MPHRAPSISPLYVFALLINLSSSPIQPIRAAKVINIPNNAMKVLSIFIIFSSSSFIIDEAIFIKNMLTVIWEYIYYKLDNIFCQILIIFREIVRNKFLYLIIFFAFAFIIFSLALGSLTIGEDNKIIVDFGLAMIEVFGLIWVLFVWSQLLFKEVEGKTIFLILSKPIKRYEFVLGKFAGFSLTIWLIILLQSILFLLVLFLKDIEITHLILFSLLFTFFKLEILLALVLFFSSFMSNMLTILVSLWVYVLGHWFSLLIQMFERLENTVLLTGTKLFQLLFPPLEALNIKDVIGSFQNFHINYFLFNSFYSIVYLIIILFFTVLIFNKKSFQD